MKMKTERGRKRETRSSRTAAQTEASPKEAHRNVWLQPLMFGNFLQLGRDLVEHLFCQPLQQYIAMKTQLGAHREATTLRQA